MFIKKSGFKKLINEAYKKGNLWCGNNEDGIYIAGGYWAMQVRDGMMTKEALGELFKLTGEIPAKGVAFRASRDGNQYEIEEIQRLNVIKNAKAAKTILEETPLVIDGYNTPARIFRDTDTGEITIASEAVLSMIDSNEVNHDGGESRPAGPFKHDCAVYFRSEHMAFCILERVDDRRKDLLEYLKGMPFEEE